MNARRFIATVVTFIVGLITLVVATPFAYAESGAYTIYLKSIVEPKSLVLAGVLDVGVSTSAQVKKNATDTVFASTSIAKEDMTAVFSIKAIEYGNVMSQLYTFDLEVTPFVAEVQGATVKSKTPITIVCTNGVATKGLNGNSAHWGAPNFSGLDVWNKGGGVEGADIFTLFLQWEKDASLKAMSNGTQYTATVALTVTTV